MWRTEEFTKQSLEHFSALASRGNVDGLVIQPLVLSDIVSIVVQDGTLHVGCIDLRRSLTIQSDEEGLFAVTRCDINIHTFYDLRDLDVMSGGGGVFDFTATYSWSASWNGSFGYYRPPGKVSARFHVDVTGGASYTLTQDKEAR